MVCNLWVRRSSYKSHITKPVVVVSWPAVLVFGFNPNEKTSLLLYQKHLPICLPILVTSKRDMYSRCHIHWLLDDSCGWRPNELGGGRLRWWKDRGQYSEKEHKRKKKNMLVLCLLPTAGTMCNIKILAPMVWCTPGYTINTTVGHVNFLFERPNKRNRWTEITWRDLV